MSATKVDKSPDTVSVEQNLQKADNGITVTGKNFRQRVEEFRLWKDEQSFRDIEYERRRTEKEKRKGTLKADPKLQRWRKCYLPSVLTILSGISVLLCSSLDGLSGEGVLKVHKTIFQAIGGVVLGLGMIGLMVTSVCTYQRENKVRLKFGYPSLLQTALTGSPSGTHLEESFNIINEFVDRRSIYSSNGNEKFKRQVSNESSQTLGLLGESFSSVSTVTAWMRQHANKFPATGTMHRRQNSDSAIDHRLARAGLLSTHKNEHSGTNDENITDAHDTEPLTSSDQKPDTSLTLSMASASSSGYHSSLSSPIIATPQSSGLFHIPVTSKLSNLPTQSSKDQSDCPLCPTTCQCDCSQNFSHAMKDPQAKQNIRCAIQVVIENDGTDIETQIENTHNSTCSLSATNTDTLTLSVPCQIPDRVAYTVH